MVPLKQPWRYFAKREDQLRGGYVGPEHVESVLRDLSSFDIYIHLNPSSGLRLRPTEAEMLGWQAVLLDADPVGKLTINPDAACQLMNDAASQLLGFTVEGAWIDSGRGAQVWVLFPVLTPAPPWSQRATRRFLNELAAVIGPRRDWRLDVGNSDLTRLARFPGSVNSKTGRRAELLRQGALDDRVPRALERWSENPSRNRATVGVSLGTVPLRGTGWGNYLSALTLSALTYLTEGSNNGSRHDSACKAAFSLRENGCDENEILRALQYGNALCEEPLPDHEVVRVWTTTRARGVR